jgi:hypothetical protein
MRTRTPSQSPSQPQPQSQSQSQSTLWKLLGALLAVAALAGCGIARDGEPRAIDKESVPVDLLLPTTAPPTTLGRDVPQKEASMFLVDERERKVVPVTRSIPIPVNTQQILRQLIGLRPTDEDSAEGLSNVITRQTRLLRVETEGTDQPTVSIDLDTFFPGLTSEEVTLAIAQMVYTVNADTPGAEVQFLVRGRPQEIRTAEGKSKEVVSCADFAKLGQEASCTTDGKGAATVVSTGTPPVPSTDASSSSAD